IILATNIAESSITIPDVQYVIDFCLDKEMVCDPETNYSCLQLVWASKANCDQRRGRAGRVVHGKCYCLVKSMLVLALEPPNINDIEVTVLKLKEIHMFCAERVQENDLRLTQKAYDSGAILTTVGNLKEQSQ
ncbi:unnamed protein product, partial [Rotaria sp. Silwood2]